MWNRDDLPAGRRLLVRGIASRPDAGRCDGMPLPEVSAGQNRSAAKSGQNKRTV